MSYLKSLSTFPILVWCFSAVFLVALCSSKPIVPTAPGQSSSAARLELLSPASLSSSSPSFPGNSAQSDGALPWNGTLVLSPTNLTAGPRPGWYFCNGTKYGRDLNGPSCLQAWADIPLLDRELSFGPRMQGPGLYDVGLPIRYLSRTYDYQQQQILRETMLMVIVLEGDGTCAIEPRIVLGHVSARAKPRDAAAAATVVIRQCK